MKKACIKMIRLYQKYISPWKRYGHCKYYPTCSNYAIEAYQKYGFFQRNSPDSMENPSMQSIFKRWI